MRDAEKLVFAGGAVGVRPRGRLAFRGLGLGRWRHWLASLGWIVLHGPDIAPDTPAAKRADYGEVVLNGRLRSALAQLNPNRPRRCAYLQ